jgi:hypothetical protein
LVGSAVLISAGCSGDSSSPEKRLIGAWKAKEGGQEMVFEFKEDKTTTMKGGPIPLSGTWSLVRAEGDKLTIKTAMELPSFKIEGDKSTVETKTQEKEFTIDFETDDRMKMAPTDDPSDAQTFDRQK